ncbi:MAG: hypothetical protein HC910_14780 [Spirulinaceae cyanobacterium SM2_1_0]|nr:hypothetical protein [Spirulinaceae cyanobacterium SM2_1_0]
MLVVLTEEQVLSPRQVCQGCLFADRSGLPRWQQGRLSCACVAERVVGNCTTQGHKASPSSHLPQHFRCQMGFQLAEIH